MVILWLFLIIALTLYIFCCPADESVLSELGQPELFDQQLRGCHVFTSSPGRRPCPASGPELPTWGERLCGTGPQQQQQQQSQQQQQQQQQHQPSKRSDVLKYHPGVHELCHRFSKCLHSVHPWATRSDIIKFTIDWVQMKQSSLASSNIDFTNQWASTHMFSEQTGLAQSGFKTCSRGTGWFLSAQLPNLQSFTSSDQIPSPTVVFHLCYHISII